jgi:hypothetical protein
VKISGLEASEGAAMFPLFFDSPFKVSCTISTSIVTGTIHKGNAAGFENEQLMSGTSQCSYVEICHGYQSMHISNLERAMLRFGAPASASALEGYLLTL